MEAVLIQTNDSKDVTSKQSGTNQISAEALRDLAVDALDGMKGVELTVIDVAEKSSFADWMIVVTGTSQRHVKSLANEVVERSKSVGNRPLGTEGELDGNWILVDLGDVSVHVMTRESREFYALEKLWQVELGKGGQRLAEPQEIPPDSPQIS